MPKRPKGKQQSQIIKPNTLYTFQRPSHPDRLATYRPVGSGITPDHSSGLSTHR